MFDMHTHVLPGMDDGSQSVGESAELLAELSRQGVRTAAATPHFYAEHMTPAAFFARRDAAFEALAPVLRESPVKLLPGAELRYFDGLRTMDHLRDFCIAGTSLFLLELPFEPWNQRVIQTVLELHASGEVTVVLAHIDRYFPFQTDEILQLFARRGIRMQINAEAFLSRRTRRNALRLLRSGRIDFLGSDCHNMKDRAPNIAPALQVIERKLGDSAAEHLLQTELWTEEAGEVP